MSKDPIVEEVRRARAKLLASCGGDLEKLMDKFAAEERRHKSRLYVPHPLRGKKRPASSR